MRAPDGPVHIGAAAVHSVPSGAGLPLSEAPWLQRVDPRLYLAAGTSPPLTLRVPREPAERLLRATAREVAALAPEDPPEVVWVSGTNELVAHLGAVTLACANGLVTLTVPVACDQAPAATVAVAFAVGTEEAPAGLVMSTYARPDGPAAVVDAWSDALIAFAWEALVRLAQTLCGATGVDAAGRPLVAGYLGASDGELLVRPMARHRPIRLRS
jgi:hypothetical protein